MNPTTDLLKPLAPQEIENTAPTSSKIEEWTPIAPVPPEAAALLEKALAYYNQQYGVTPSAQYPYHNESGELLGFIVRWDKSNGKKEIRPYRYCETNNGKKEWKGQGFEEPRPLYNLHRIKQRSDAPILVCEGEKAADAAAALFPDCVTTTAMHGAQSPHKSDWSCMRGRQVIIAPDNDGAGKKYADVVYKLCIEADAASVKLLCPSIFACYAIKDESIVEHTRELSQGYDLADAATEGWAVEYISQLEDWLRQNGESLFTDYTPYLKEVSPDGTPDRKLRVVTLRELLATPLPPRENILAPWLQTQSLCMVHSIRGVGKTHFALGVAWAVATGSKFLVWEAPQPREVLYLDGEMPANALQERLAKMCLDSESPYADNLRILTPDLQERGMPNLATEDGQELINVLLTPEIKLIVVDNLSCLVRGVRENEGQSWDAISEWALQMRQKGVSVLFIHHSGKNGTQRGTSRKEDILDAVINLKHPEDYTPEDGARFEVRFEKARHLTGKDIQPFVARLTSEYEKHVWDITLIDDSRREQVIKLLNDGCSQRKTAKILGIDHSTVSRHAEKARKLGLVKLQPKSKGRK